MSSRKWLLVITLAAVAGAAILVGCSSSSNMTTSTTPASTGQVIVTLSDPSTCSAPQGPYKSVFVTVTDVQISTNANAADNDSSFIDLTPALKSNPVQIDLLGAATSQCFLATLGAAMQLTPGSFQQIRVFLQDNSATPKPTGNKCGADSNCVVLGDSSVHTLQLSSESKTGIKIPSGQIGGGQFTIAAGQSKTLNLDFDACASIVIQGNGQFRLKPVLHAGEVSTTASTSIGGKVVDKATSAAIVGGKTIVALEQKDSAGIDRVVMQTVADSGGNFTFCPVAAGTYDVVVVAVNGTNVSYAASITTGVQPGASLGNIPLNAVTGTSTAQASITGSATSTTGTAGTVADLAISALQSVTIGGSAVQVTIPLAQQSSATATLNTAAGAGCPATTDCASYTLQVPAANPTTGAFNSAGTTYTAGAAGTVAYSVNAEAFIPSSGGKADCTTSSITTSLTSTSTPLVVTPGTSVTAATLAFTGCQ